MAFFSPARKVAECGQAILCLPCALCCGGMFMAIFGILILVSAVTDDRGHAIEKYNESVLKWTAEGFKQVSNSTATFKLSVTRVGDGTDSRQLDLPKQVFTGVPAGDEPANTKDDHIESYKGAYYGPKTDNLFRLTGQDDRPSYSIVVTQTVDGTDSEVFKQAEPVTKEGRWTSAAGFSCDRDESVGRCEDRCRDYCRRNTPSFGGCRFSGRDCQIQRMQVATELCVQMELIDAKWTSNSGCFDKDERVKWGDASGASFSTTARLRSKLDPYNTLMRQTDNSGRFGATQAEKAALGTALTVIGVLMIVFVVACVMCLKKTFLEIYRGRKGGNSAPPVSQGGHYQQVGGTYPAGGMAQPVQQFPGQGYNQGVYGQQQQFYPQQQQPQQYPNQYAQPPYGQQQQYQQQYSVPPIPQHSNPNRN